MPASVLDGTAAPAPAAQEAPAAGEKEKDPEERQGKAASGAPHVLITRIPDGRLTFLQAMASRRKAALAARPVRLVLWVPDHRRLRRLPASSFPAGRHP